MESERVDSMLWTGVHAMDWTLHSESERMDLL
jgi:hypothetical protein